MMDGLHDICPQRVSLQRLKTENMWEEVEARSQTHFEEHLHLQGGEAVALLYSWIPFEK